MCQYTRFLFTDLYSPVNGMPVCCDLHIKNFEGKRILKTLLQQPKY